MELIDKLIMMFLMLTVFAFIVLCYIALDDKHNSQSSNFNPAYTTINSNNTRDYTFVGRK